jgi:hypothetical protein
LLQHGHVPLPALNCRRDHRLILNRRVILRDGVPVRPLGVV